MYDHISVSGDSQAARWAASPHDRKDADTTDKGEVSTDAHC